LALYHASAALTDVTGHTIKLDGGLSL